MGGARSAGRPRTPGGQAEGTEIGRRLGDVFRRRQVRSRRGARCRADLGSAIRREALAASPHGPWVPRAAYGLGLAGPLLAVAVLCERTDRAIDGTTGVVSGHTLRPLAAGAAVPVLARTTTRREGRAPRA